MTEHTAGKGTDGGGMVEEGQKRFGLNRDIIKYFAMFTMFLNHFAGIFLTPGTIMYEVFTDIGYFTAVTMCYFLVEGYGYTHSKSEYAHRLFLFALISQIPYTLALGMYQLNMLFTLWFCFLILIVKDKKEWGLLRIPVIILIILATSFTDWPWLAAIYTVMFSLSGRDKKQIAASYAAAAVMFALFNYLSYSVMFPAGGVLQHAVFASLGIVVSGIVILCFYNGQRAEKGRKFSKWFFYIFYPAHLIVLGLFRFII